MSIVRWLSAALMTLAAATAATAQSTPLSSFGVTMPFAQESRPVPAVYAFMQIEVPTLQVPVNGIYDDIDDIAVDSVPASSDAAIEKCEPRSGRGVCVRILKALATAVERLAYAQAEENDRPSSKYEVPPVQFTGPLTNPVVPVFPPDADDVPDCAADACEDRADSLLFSTDCGYMKKFLEYCKKNGPLGYMPVCSALADACCNTAARGSAKSCCRTTGSVACCCAKGSPVSTKASCCSKDCKCDPCACAEKGTCCAGKAQAKCGCGKECACCKCAVKPKKTRSVRLPYPPIHLNPQMPDWVCPCPMEAGLVPFLPFEMPVPPPGSGYSVIAVSPPMHGMPVPHPMLGSARRHTQAWTAPMPAIEGFVARPAPPPMPPMPMQHPGCAMPPFPGLPTPAQALHDLNCVRNLAEARARAAMHHHAEMAVAHNSDRAHLATPNLDAHCDRLSCAGNGDHVLLEGDVRLTCKRNGTILQVNAQRLLVNVKDGTFTTLDTERSVSIRHQPVHTPVHMPGCPVEPTSHTRPVTPVCPEKGNLDRPARVPLVMPEDNDD